MINSKFFRSKLVVLGLLGAFALLILPKDGLAQAQRMGSMTGFIFGTDSKTPVTNAVVKIRNLQTGSEFQSSPTDKNGLYRIKDVQAGRYVLGVSDEKGDFNFAYELMIKGGEVAKLAVALRPGVAKQDNQDENKRRKAFFLTPLGIAVLVAAGGLLIYGGYELFGEDDSSPSKK